MSAYPKNMEIKTFTKDCFDGATETPEAIELKEKYLPKMSNLAKEFTEDCIKNHIESISSIGFFFAWLYPQFVEAQIGVLYNHLHEVGCDAAKIYKFEKVDETR